jgi:hypothetical protein
MAISWKLKTYVSTKHGIFSATALQKLIVKKIEPAGENFYKVTMDVEMKPESANAVMPFYGYDNGENIRWIGLIKVDNLWRITGLATGP